MDERKMDAALTYGAARPESHERRSLPLPSPRRPGGVLIGLKRAALGSADTLVRLFGTCLRFPGLRLAGSGGPGVDTGFAAACPHGPEPETGGTAGRMTLEMA